MTIKAFVTGSKNIVKEFPKIFQQSFSLSPNDHVGP